MLQSIRILVLITAWASLALPAARAQEDDTVLVVPLHRLGAYWTPDHTATPRYPLNASRRMEEGCATVSYVIESDGTTSSHRVETSWPNDVFAHPSLEATRKLTYLPAPENAKREAVYTSYTFTFLLNRNQEKNAEIQESLARVCLSKVKYSQEGG